MTFNMPPHIEPDNCGNYIVMNKGENRMGGNEFALAMQCGYKQGYEDGAIAELEKIKAEIEEVSYADKEFDGERNVDLKDVDSILNEHIAELKGEQE